MLNSTALVGRMTKDPELKYTQSGKSVANFTLAVERNFKDANGEKLTDFINCVIWGKGAETLCNYTHKGSMIGVVGELNTRSYENQQGQKVFVTEVNVRDFQFLSYDKDNEHKQASIPAADPFKPMENDPTTTITDDALPF